MSKVRGQKLDSEATYRFCGEGQGIPGLPHELTAAQAEKMGMLKVLQGALENGNYKAVTTKVVTTTKE